MYESDQFDIRLPINPHCFEEISEDLGEEPLQPHHSQDCYPHQNRCWCSKAKHRLQQKQQSPPPLATAARSQCPLFLLVRSLHLIVIPLPSPPRTAIPAFQNPPPPRAGSNRADKAYPQRSLRNVPPCWSGVGCGNTHTGSVACLDLLD